MARGDQDGEAAVELSQVTVASDRNYETDHSTCTSPPHFEETRIDELHRYITDHPLGALVVNGSQGLDANHLPFELDAGAGTHGRLLAHVARANPLWQEAKDGEEVLVIFSATNAYISPNWYPSKHEAHRLVPTWSASMAVHLDDVPELATTLLERIYAGLDERPLHFSLLHAQPGEAGPPTLLSRRLLPFDYGRFPQAGRGSAPCTYLSSAALVAGLQDPAIKNKLLDLGFEIVGNTPEQFTAFQASEFARWQKVIEVGKITAD